MTQQKEKPNPKTIIITGGGSGIGLETAKELVEKSKDIKVVLIGKDNEKLQDALNSLDTYRQQVSILSCDLNSPEETRKCGEKIIQSHKHLYGLVNNAGVYPFGGLFNTTEETWDLAMNVNLKASFLLAQILAPELSKHPSGGRIVNVSSTAGLLPNHFALAYSVSKAALVQLTKTLAKELGKDGITVNCVCPGIVRTPLHENYHASQRDLEDFYSRRGAAFPMGRVGEPKDVAASIRFFLSEEANWITGDVHVVDGGRLLL